MTLPAANAPDPGRTAHIMAGAHQGGAELFYERLLPALHDAGETVLPIIRRNESRAARLTEAGTPPLQRGFGGRLDLLTRLRLRRDLTRFAPRTAIVWMGRAARHTPAGAWVLIGRLGGTYDLRQFAHCDHLVGNTPGMVAWIRAQGFPAHRTHLLPNFAPDVAGAAPAALPVPPGARTILAMGRLHRAKGFDVLIAAMTRLPAIHAIIAGDGPERAALTDLAARAGIAARTHFLGWRTDTASLLAACDLLVCPSRHEPLGNVILEAFSASRPVVAATAEGPSWLLEGGTRGILVPAESGIALSAAIEAMLANPDMAARMAAAGRAHFETHFAQAPVVRAWQDFCHTVEKA
jgi:glycosyltransferase involved in cell wall biosynthesis